MPEVITTSWLLSQVIVDEQGCWLWSKGKDSSGYGTVKLGRKPDRKTRGAHRVSYELFVGPIPDGFQLDHLCRVRACVNPNHVQPVTSRENTLRGESTPARLARQTHCIRGHLLSGDNLYCWRGSRICRECRRSRKASLRSAEVSS